MDGYASSKSLNARTSMSLEWKNEFSVNIPNVDNQHRKLIELISNLDETMRRGGEKQLLGQTLAVVIRYTRYHFDTEERLMAATAYPGIANHIEEHKVLLRTIVEFERLHERGAVEFTPSIMGFLEEWLVTHMLRLDKPMGEYLRAADAKSTSGEDGKVGEKRD
jgi:hemerythrin-like metal-binding protein